MANSSTTPEISKPGKWLYQKLKAIGDFLALVIGLVPDVLKMLRDILKAIPPLAAGIIAAALVTWFFLSLLTSDHTIRLIFAFTLSVLALACMALAFAQKFLDFKKDILREESERLKTREEHQMQLLILQTNQLSDVEQKVWLLQKLADILKNPAPSDGQAKEKLESTMKKILLAALEEISGPDLKVPNHETSTTINTES